MRQFETKNNVVSHLTSFIIFTVRFRLFGSEYKENKQNAPKEMIFAFGIDSDLKKIFDSITTITQFNQLVLELFEPVKEHIIKPSLKLISDRVDITSFNVNFIREDGRRILPFVGQVRNIEISLELKGFNKFNFRLDNLLGLASQTGNFARVKYELSDIFVKQIAFLLLPFGVYIQNKKLEVQTHIMENVIQNGLHVDLSNLLFLPPELHYLTLVYVSFKTNTIVSLKSNLEITRPAFFVIETLIIRADDRV